MCLFSEFTVAGMIKFYSTSANALPSLTQVIQSSKKAGALDRIAFKYVGTLCLVLPVPRSSRSIGLMMTLLAFTGRVPGLSRHFAHMNSVVLLVLVPFPGRNAKVQGT